MTELGRIPRVGDTVGVARVELVVEAMEGRRVTRLRVRAADAPGNACAGTGAGR